MVVGHTMGPRSLRLGSVFHDGERVLHVHGERVLHALRVCENLNVLCCRPMYVLKINSA